MTQPYLSSVLRGPGRTRAGRSVTVYPAETYTSPDGNTMRRVSAVGTAYAGCAWQPLSATETDEIGYLTVQAYRLRLPYGAVELPPGSRVVVDDETYTTKGYGMRYGSTPRTAHVDYRCERK